MKASQPPAQVWAGAMMLACKLTVDMPLPGFCVRDILQLKPDFVVDSHWRLDIDVPLRVNGKLIACGEFEVAGNHLAVRVTELE